MLYVRGRRQVGEKTGKRYTAIDDSITPKEREKRKQQVAIAALKAAEKTIVDESKRLKINIKENGVERTPIHNIQVRVGAGRSYGKAKRSQNIKNVYAQPRLAPRKTYRKTGRLRSSRNRVAAARNQHTGGRTKASSKDIQNSARALRPTARGLNPTGRQGLIPTGRAAPRRNPNQNTPISVWDQMIMNDIELGGGVPLNWF